MNEFFSWIFAKLENLYISYVVRSYESAVHLHRGKVLRVTGPGVWLKFPFDIDHITIVDHRISTSNLSTQVVPDDTGRNGFAVGVVVVWRIREDGAEQFVTKMLDQSVIDDTVTGMVGEEFEEGAKPFSAARKSILANVRRRLGRMGVEVVDIYLTDFGPCRIFRLVQSD